MFHDFFLNAIKPFLSDHFSRVVYYWQIDFDLSVIEHEKPDVIIYEVVERKLMRHRLPSSDRLQSLMKRKDPPRTKDRTEKRDPAPPDEKIGEAVHGAASGE